MYFWCGGITTNKRFVVDVQSTVDKVIVAADACE